MSRTTRQKPLLPNVESHKVLGSFGQKRQTVANLGSTGTYLSRNSNQDGSNYNSTGPLSFQPKNAYNLENRNFNKDAFLAELEAKQKRRKELDKQSKYGYQLIESGKVAGEVKLSDFEPTFNIELKNQAFSILEQEAYKRGQTNMENARFMKIASDLNKVQKQIYKRNDKRENAQNQSMPRIGNNLAAVNEYSITNQNSTSWFLHSNSSASLPGQVEETVKNAFNIEIKDDNEYDMDIVQKYQNQKIKIEKPQKKDDKLKSNVDANSKSPAVVSKNAMLERARVETSVRNYKYKMEVDRRIREQNLSPEQILQEDIEKGKFPKLKASQMKLQYIYHKKAIEEQDYVRKSEIRMIMQQRGMQRMLNNLTDDEFKMFVRKLKNSEHSHLIENLQKESRVSEALWNKIKSIGESRSQSVLKPQQQQSSLTKRNDKARLNQSSLSQLSTVTMGEYLFNAIKRSPVTNPNFIRTGVPTLKEQSEIYFPVDNITIKDAAKTRLMKEAPPDSNREVKRDIDDMIYEAKLDAVDSEEWFKKMKESEEWNYDLNKLTEKQQPNEDQKKQPVDLKSLKVRSSKSVAELPQIKNKKDPTFNTDAKKTIDNEKLSKKEQEWSKLQSTILTRDRQHRLVIAENIVKNNKDAWTKNPIQQSQSQKLSNRGSTTRKNILNVYVDRDTSEKQKMKLSRKMQQPEFSPYVYEKTAKTIQTDEQYDRHVNSIKSKILERDEELKNDKNYQIKLKMNSANQDDALFKNIDMASDSYKEQTLVLDLLNKPTSLGLQSKNRELRNGNAGILMKNKNFKIQLLPQESKKKLQEMEKEMSEMQKTFEVNKHKKPRQEELEIQKKQQNEQFEQFLYKHATINEHPTESDSNSNAARKFNNVSQYYNDESTQKYLERKKKAKKEVQKIKQQEESGKKQHMEYVTVDESSHSLAGSLQQQNLKSDQKRKSLHANSQNVIDDLSYTEDTYDIYKKQSQSRNESEKSNDGQNEDEDGVSFTDSYKEVLERVKADPLLNSLYQTQKKFYKTNTTFDLESNQSNSDFDKEFDLDFQMNILDQVKDNLGKKVQTHQKSVNKPVGVKIKQPNVNQTRAMLSEVMKRKIVERLQLESNKKWAKQIQKYRVSHRLVEIHQFKGISVTDPLVKYYVEADRKFMYPRSNGFINKQSIMDVFSLQNQFVSKEFLPALCKGISAGVRYTTLQLRNSSLNSESGILILDAMIKQNIKFLDLSENPMFSSKFYYHFAKILDDREFKLEKLFLEGNKMQDDHCRVLCDVIQDKASMLVLNFNNNQLTDKSAKYLCEILQGCHKLQELHVSYNQIFSRGSVMIAETLRDYPGLRVLDISFNSICSVFAARNDQKKLDAAAEAAKAWAECFKKNDELMHLDIRHNNIKWNEMEIMAEGLKSNHSILGIHVKGNEAWVDSWGFIRPLHDYQLVEIFFDKTLKTNNKSGVFSNIQQQIDMYDNCWICGGWNEVEFEYSPGFSDNSVDLAMGEEHDEYIAINMHMDSDEYEGDLLLPHDAKESYRFDHDDSMSTQKVYKTVRMVPPGERKYFFSIAGHQYCAKDHHKIEIRKIQEILFKKQPKKRKTIEMNRKIDQMIENDLSDEKDEDSFQNELDMMFQDYTQLKEINVVRKVPFREYELTAKELQQLQTKPRTLKSLKSRTMAKTPWLFNKSVFSMYKADTERILNKCFFADWEQIQPNIDLFVKDTTDRVDLKNVLLENYKVIRDSYKYLAGQDLLNNFPSIGGTVFGQFMMQASDFVDNKTVGIKDLDLAKAAVKGKDVKKSSNKMIPADRLIRYNFLEIFVRIAKQKFIDPKVCTTYASACQKMFDDYLIPSFSNLDSHIWRRKQLWNEQNDLALKRQYKVLHQLFEKYTGPNKNKRFILADEFMAMMEQTGIFQTELGRNDVLTMWNLSMQTQVDELTSERHLQMHFSEFVEAICRVAEKVVIPNFFRDKDYKHMEDYIGQGLNSQNYHTYKKRPFPAKIEAFIILLGRQCLPSAVQFMQTQDLKQHIINDLLANDILFQFVK